MRCTADNFDLIHPPKPRFIIHYLGTDKNVTEVRQINRRHGYLIYLVDQSNGKHVGYAGPKPPDMDEMLYNLLVKPYLWM